MSDLTHQILDTNLGTSKVSETESKKRGRPFKDVPRETFEQTDTPDSFERKIGQAQLDGAKWVETDPKMFDYLVKNQKVKPDHIMYKNIMVTTHGQTEAIKTKHNISADDQW